MNFRTLFAAFVLATPIAAGCAVDAQNDGADDSTADEAELSAAGRALEGAYEESGAGDLRALVLSTQKATASKNHFMAIVDTHIKCIVAPCPTDARLEGTFSATKSVLTLNVTSTDGIGGDTAKTLLDGKYRYDLVKLGGGKAKLHLVPLPKSGGTVSAINIPGSLEKVSSYCDNDITANEDCRGEGLPEPLCGGSPSGGFPHGVWNCSSSHRCSFGGCIVGPGATCDKLDQSECQTTHGCRAEFGPSHCSTGPTPICTKDFVFKACVAR